MLHLLWHTITNSLSNIYGCLWGVSEVSQGCLWGFSGVYLQCLWGVSGASLKFLWAPVLFDTKSDKMTVAILDLYGRF